MKAKLIKDHYGFEYFLADENGSAIATSYNGKLSKQNCDEIFGVVDVEKLAREWHKQKNFNGLLDNIISIGYLNMFKDGFNKAMELNKDKVFTLEDMKKAIDKAKQGSVKETHNGYGRPTETRFVLDDLSYEEIIQSLQQSKEIAVEIEMFFLGFEMESGVKMEEPKLDSDGCLILKKK